MKKPSLAAEAGADVFVAGSSIFGNEAAVASAMDRLRTEIARQHVVLNT